MKSKLKLKLLLDLAAVNYQFISWGLQAFISCYSRNALIIWLGITPASFIHE